MNVNKNRPYIIFLTGASGVGKTTLIRQLEKEMSHPDIHFYHFDSIHIPTVAEMEAQYGSPSEWQKAMTFQWISRILHDSRDNKVVLFEGQVNLDFIKAAFAKEQHDHYEIILIHCDQTTRHQRLKVDRQQAELVNENMDNWANYLKQQAERDQVTLLDTSHLSVSEALAIIKQKVQKHFSS